MEPTDEELTAQPIGYWSGVAHKAVIKYINDTMATRGITQWHWMTVNAVARVETGVTRDDLAAYLSEFLDVAALPSLVEDLLERGWFGIVEQQRLVLTEAGIAGRAEIKKLTADIRAGVHQGITDDEYVSALKVLRRMISNVGGNAELPDARPLPAKA